VTTAGSIYHNLSDGHIPYAAGQIIAIAGIFAVTRGIGAGAEGTGAADAGATANGASWLSRLLEPKAIAHAHIAPEGAGTGDLSEAFHYTRAQNVASIEENGLRAGSYATPRGDLSPTQAQIDLALPPNRGLPGAMVRVDVAGLRQAGYDIPKVTQVGRSFNMPGGGEEMQFPYPIPPEFLKVVAP
ncbi:MAG: hypothetical protein QOJ73_2477, partial [Streptosporangiaceae bacterium]|nr:hypothetical protein [Streptosporangiaceae bacterium]